MTRALVIVCLVLAGGTAAAQSLTLSPAVVPLLGRPGQSTTQHLTLFNGTSQAHSFELVAKDVVVRDGQRQFVDAGELRGSIAATAVFSARSLRVPPGQERAVDVTVTLPAQMPCRAIVVMFQGTTLIGGRATASIGSLLTFDLAGRLSISPGGLQVAPPTTSTNARFTIPVINDGTEPTIVRGVAAILDASGALVGKVAIEPHRLLPGERAELHADYPGELRTGSYRIAATIESAKRAWSRSAGLDVP
jgi:hypothetical protein